MKASLLARAAPTFLLATILACGVGSIGFAQTQTPSPSAGASNSPTPAPAGAASSDSAATPAPAPQSHHSMMTHMHGSKAASSETMSQMADQRITDLHTRLHITDQQQSQWDQFAQVMRGNAKDLDEAYQQRATSFGKMNAVENMQSYAQIEQTRAQDLQKLVPAFQTLYTALSDDQKKEADQLFRNQAAQAQQRRAKASHG